MTVAGTDPENGPSKVANKRSAPTSHTCGICETPFKRLEHLQRHVSSFHSTKDPKPHGCQYCGRRFMRRDVLLRHYNSCKSMPERMVSEKNGPVSSKAPENSVTENEQWQHHEQEQRTSPDAGPAGSASALYREAQQVGLIDDFLYSQAEDAPASSAGSPPGNSARQDLGVDSQPHKNRTGNKRGKYVPNACVNCQKRKVKCTGEEVCVPCRSVGLECTYNQGRKRRKTASSAQAPRCSGVQVDSTRENHDTSSSALTELMERMYNLEREYDYFRRQVAFSGQDDSTISSSSSEGADERDIASPVAEQIQLPDDSTFIGPSNLLKSIEVLNSTVDLDDHYHPTNQTQILSPTHFKDSPTEWNEPSPRAKINILRASEQETRLLDVSDLRLSVKVFFECLNPHYPALNENQFRESFEAFLSGDLGRMSTADRFQFTALVNLMHAEVRLLMDDCPDDNHLPAWTEFCRAENILNGLLWLGNGDLLTIQCLLLKARYLLYLERGQAAYDTVSRIVRLLFQLGIHDQASWIGYSPFEVVMRQRIFWTCFYFERSLSMNCGLPSHLRESDFQVDFPGNYNDKLLFPNESLPLEDETSSFSPNLVAAATWGRLGAEIWDSVFAVRASKSRDLEFVVSMDARITYSMKSLPYFFQNHQPEITSGLPAYIGRQRNVLHMRMSHLRLLLRQEYFLGYQFTNDMAAEAISVVASLLDTIERHVGSPDAPTGRFTAVFHMVGAIVPLVCILFKRDCPRTLQTDAIHQFRKGMSILIGLAPAFVMARHVLQRLRRIIEMAERAITRFQGSEPTITPECQLPDLRSSIPMGIEGPSDLEHDKDMFQHLFNNHIPLNPTLLDTADAIDPTWANDGFANSAHMGFPLVHN